MVRYYEFVNLNEGDMPTQDPRILRAIALHKAGKKNTEIAKELSLDLSLIGKWLKKHYPDYQKPFIGHPDEVKHHAVKLHQAGKTFQEIGNILGCNSDTVNRWIIELDPTYEKKDYSTKSY